MSRHFFILGHIPLLSAWEIIKRWPSFSQKNYYTDDFFIAETNDGFRAKEALENLGGTIKIGRIIGEIAPDRIFQIGQLFPLIEGILIKSKRPIFGLSYYGNEPKTRSSVREIGLKIKKQLKEKGISSRFVVSRQTVLSSVVVVKNKLIEKGAELIFLPVRNTFYLGITEAVQAFADYSWRDYSRPQRDSHSGMLPPKLAKIMINLAQIPKSGLLLDPFCGSGTILQEAMLLGYQNIIGSDQSAKAVDAATKNIQWLLKNSKNKIAYKIIQSDCQKIFQQMGQVAGVVTEPYLGPPNWNDSRLADIIKQISELYLGFFSAAARHLSRNTPLVIVLPVWQTLNKKIFLPILSEVKNRGWQMEEFTIGHQKYDSVIYERPGQRVLRQIIVFRKK
jgi:tRNA G10  N-methylase Trm11